MYTSLQNIQQGKQKVSRIRMIEPKSRLSHEEGSVEASIIVENISKTYKFYPSPKKLIIQQLYNKLNIKRKYYQEYKALKDISFSVYPGETVGIVGKNGSGKSTLLEIIAGTLTPDHGTVKREGRIGALLELGSGFNPEYTGIQNIIFSAQIMGVKKKEIDKLLDTIIAFADIGEFIEKPIRTYSSGMTVRLAFSVQSHTNPSILIVDEALAVGDDLFQKKCFNHINKLKKQGVSILLVTHSSQQINKHCDRAILMNSGKIKMIGKPSLITSMYQQLATKEDIEWDPIINRHQEYIREKRNKKEKENPKTLDRHTETIKDIVSESKLVYKDEGVKIISTKLKTILKEEYINELEYGESFEIEIRYEADKEIDGLLFGCHISNKEGQRLTGLRMPTELDENPFTAHKGERWKVTFSFRGELWPGIYFIGAGVYVGEQEDRRFIHRVIDILAFRIKDKPNIHRMGLCSMAIKKPELRILKGKDRGINEDIKDNSWGE